MEANIINKKNTILTYCFRVLSTMLLIILLPLFFIYWLCVNLFYWFINKFNLDRSSGKIRITEHDQQCLIAIGELNKLEIKDWINKYDFLYCTVYVQSTCPSNNYIKNTYRGIEYTHITQFVNEYTKLKAYKLTHELPRINRLRVTERVV